MYFDSLQAMLYMDGHGPYVWAAYLITLAAIGFVLVSPLRRSSRFLGQLSGELRRASGAQESKEESNASGT
jgi:heme exporter protein D